MFADMTRSAKIQIWTSDYVVWVADSDGEEKEGLPSTSAEME